MYLINIAFIGKWIYESAVAISVLYNINNTGSTRRVIYILRVDIIDIII